MSVRGSGRGWWLPLRPHPPSSHPQPLLPRRELFLERLAARRAGALVALDDVRCAQRVVHVLPDLRTPLFGRAASLEILAASVATARACLPSRTAAPACRRCDGRCGTGCPWSRDIRRGWSHRGTRGPASARCSPCRSSRWFTIAAAIVRQLLTVSYARKTMRLSSCRSRL